jgi:DNA-binding transcriptional LysR family regulator
MNTRFFAKSGLSLERLRTFMEIVSAKGMSNAAPGDSIRQSQFSRQLRELEEFFGAELLIRGRGRFELTQAGRDLFRIVQSHFSAMQDLADQCSIARTEVNLGAGESLLQWLLLSCFASLRTALPSVTFILHNLQTDEIASRLRDGRLDLGIARQDEVKTPLKCTRLGVVEYRVAVPKASFRPEDKGDVWGALKRHPVALLADSEITSALENTAEKKRTRLNVCLRGSSYAQLVEAVRSAGCAAILPAFVSQAQAGADVEFLPLTALKKYRRPIALA